MNNPLMEELKNNILVVKTKVKKRMATKVIVAQGNKKHKL